MTAYKEYVQRFKWEKDRSKHHLRIAGLWCDWDWVLVIGLPLMFAAASTFFLLPWLFIAGVVVQLLSMVLSQMVFKRHLRMAEIHIKRAESLEPRD